MKIEHVVFPSVLSKLRILCRKVISNDIRFLEPTKIESLKMDHVNGPLVYETSTAN